MNDTISRQAAITVDGYADGFADGYKLGKKYAQPQRTGRWELIDDTEFRVPGYRCSVCHCECEDWDKKPTYRFCPNCGAKMEGES
jgi:hypothetical protein